MDSSLTSSAPRRSRRARTGTSYADRAAAELLLAVGHGRGGAVRLVRPGWLGRRIPGREAQFWRRAPTSLMIRLIPAGQPRGARWHRVYADLTGPPPLFVLHRGHPYPLPGALAAHHKPPRARHHDDRTLIT